MNATTRMVIVAGFLLGLVACGSDKNSNKSPDNDQDARAPRKTVFDPYIQDLNKAKQVSGKLEAEKQKTDQALQQAEAGTTSAQPAPAQPPRR